METAKDAAVETGGSVSEEVMALFTVDGFDYDKAAEFIDGTELSGMVKTTMKAGLQKAQDNPDLLQTALEKARETLGF